MRAGQTRSGGNRGDGARRRTECRAFTLIEMVVVTAIVAMMAALIVPNLVTIHETRLLHSLEAAILRLPVEARNEALRAGEPMILRVSGNSLVMERWAESDTDADPSNPQDVEQVKTVDLDGAIQVDGAQTNGTTIDPGSWRWIVYPDGSAFSAGLTFRIGSGEQSLWIPANGGRPEWRSGDLPDTSTESWPAGDLQQRTS